MNLLLIASLFLADMVVYPLPPEKVDPSTVAVTNEFRGAWWNKPYHERYRILVDFDFDGHDDMLLSEPMADFGTGGGCWTAYHWTNGLYQAVGSFGAHYAAWSFDKDTGDSGGLRFWYYWHSSCREGTLGYYIISANGVKDDKGQRFSITYEGCAHRATANETHRADDDAPQAVGDCQADQADGGDLPVEEGCDSTVLKRSAGGIATRRVATDSKCRRPEH